jgi:thiol-disulfide isomerase/thioredoxin
MRFLQCAGVSAILTAAFAAGCGKAPTRPVTTTEHATPADATPTAIDDTKTAPNPTETVTLVDASVEDFRELLKKHEGKVIFVDYWATWCGNCMEEFPHTVALAEKHKGDGLVVISVALETDPTDATTRTAAKKFLEEKGAKFDNLLYTGDGTSQQAYDEFEIGDLPIPHFQLFDRQGKLIRKFTYSDPNNPLAPEEIDQAIEAALTVPQS